MYDQLQEVPEENLKMASAMFAPGNCYQRALELGEAFRVAGLTPLFFLDDKDNMIRVTTEEKIYGKFH